MKPAGLTIRVDDSKAGGIIVVKNTTPRTVSKAEDGKGRLGKTLLTFGFVTVAPREESIAVRVVLCIILLFCPSNVTCF